MPSAKNSYVNHSGIAASWRDAGPQIRRIMILFLLSGVGLWILGFLGDDRGWWADRPFFTNFVSSLTAACFGIPFAMLVLRYLQSVHRARSEVLGDLRNALISMSTSLDEIIGRNVADRLESSVREARESYDAVNDAGGGATARDWRGVLGRIGKLWKAWHPDDDFDPKIRQMMDLWKGEHEGAKARMNQASVPPLEKAILGKIDRCFDHIWTAFSTANLKGRYGSLERDLQGGQTSSHDIRRFLEKYQNLVARLADLRRTLDEALVASL